MSSQSGSPNLLQGLVSLSIFILFKRNELWPHYQKHVNQIILNRIILIWGLHFNFVDCESFLESNSWDSCSVWDKPGWLNFSVRAYLCLIQKNSSTHMHGLTVYLKEGLLFAWDLSLENCRFLLMFLTDFTSLSIVLLFPLLITVFVFMQNFWFYFI